ncbi:class I SAM-dependent methyltransferase [Paenibacillus septentrionalis]|uniref:S-adenosyl-L-methionine-dependent methyltransferase n=1 Tax=Paenibacillus septentrionalis TaxID=429342 RepID=A0ABW1V2J6_9BACL
MSNKSLTALVSAFARVYHSEQYEATIFKDSLARQLMTEQEYDTISSNMCKAIQFFQPDFTGSEQEALRYVVNNQLSPSPLGRSSFTERALQQAAVLGARQYLILAAGYDTFAYRQPAWAEQLSIFEIDHPNTAADKQSRISRLQWDVPANLQLIAADFNDSSWTQKLLANTHYSTSARSFASMLGISYYLTKEAFSELLTALANSMPAGSSVVFDYPDELTFTPQAGSRAQKQVMMAASAGEPMQASYSYLELESLLEQAGWLIYEHLTPAEITDQLFKHYNENNPQHPITAFDNVNYCLAVKR